MSTPTGIPPAYFTAAKVDNHDKQGTNTSSFFLILEILILESKH